MLPGQSRYFRLDLKPETVTSGKIKYTRHDLHSWSPERIFAQDDLYTTRWADITNVEIEQFFFGQLDFKAPAAIDFFATFDHQHFDEEALHLLLRYMSVQKLRTPKGLALLAAQTQSAHTNLTLISLQRLQDLCCTMDRMCLADCRRFWLTDKIYYLLIIPLLCTTVLAHRFQSGASE